MFTLLTRSRNIKKALSTLLLKEILILKFSLASLYYILIINKEVITTIYLLPLYYLKKLKIYIYYIFEILL